jgi:DNA-directed RNA polymerase subunit RPC12/RpoP
LFQSTDVWRIKMSEKCPYCNSSNISEINSTLTENEYVCRSCKEQWSQTHTGGNIIKATGTLLSGALVLLTLFGGGSDNSSGGGYS